MNFAKADGITERHLEIVESVLETAVPELVKMVDEHQKPLDELFGIVVAQDDDVMCLVSELTRRQEFIDSMSEDPEIQQQLADVDSVASEGLLRIVIVFVAEGHAASGRMRVQLRHPEGGAA